MQAPIQLCIDVVARENPMDKHIIHNGFEPCTSIWFEPWFIHANTGLSELPYDQTCHKIGSPAPKPVVSNPHGLIDVVGVTGRYLKIFLDVDGCSWKFRNVNAC